MGTTRNQFSTPYRGDHIDARIERLEALIRRVERDLQRLIDHEDRADRARRPYGDGWRG
jgi:hypothetical protein